MGGQGLLCLFGRLFQPGGIGAFLGDVPLYLGFRCEGQLLPQQRKSVLLFLLTGVQGGQSFFGFSYCLFGLFGGFFPEKCLRFQSLGAAWRVGVVTIVEIRSPVNGGQCRTMLRSCTPLCPQPRGPFVLTLQT